MIPLTAVLDAEAERCGIPRAGAPLTERLRTKAGRCLSVHKAYVDGEQVDVTAVLARTVVTVRDGVKTLTPMRDVLVDESDVVWRSTGRMNWNTIRQGPSC